MSSDLFIRAASPVFLPTHSFLPISQPSDHVCLSSLSFRHLSCNFQLRHRSTSHTSRNSVDWRQYPYHSFGSTRRIRLHSLVQSRERSRRAGHIMGTREGGSAQSPGHFQVCLLRYPYCFRTDDCCRFLIGDTDGAKADLEESLKLVPSLTQTWVKIASVHMERGDPSKAFEAFDEAVKHNASDPDIYYHRGQGSIPINFYRPLRLFRHSAVHSE